jgi:hypothetical protein
MEMPRVVGENTFCRDGFHARPLLRRHTTSLFGAAQPRITSTAAFRSTATSDGEATRILIVLACAGIALRFIVYCLG